MNVIIVINIYLVSTQVSDGNSYSY